MLVAIGAKQFPVATVGRVVLVVTVLMMDLKELEIAAVEGPGTPPAPTGKALTPALGILWHVARRCAGLRGRFGLAGHSIGS